MNPESPWKGRINAVGGVVILLVIIYALDRAFNLVRSLNPAHPSHCEKGRWHYRYGPAHVFCRLWLGAIPWAIFLSLLTYHAICFHLRDAPIGIALGNKYEYGFPWLVFVLVCPLWTAILALRLRVQWGSFKARALEVTPSEDADARILGYESVKVHRACAERLSSPVLYRQWALEQFRTAYKAGSRLPKNRMLDIIRRMPEEDVKWMTGQFPTFETAQ